MFLFRLLIFIVFVYIVYRLVKNLFTGHHHHDHDAVGGDTGSGVQPPYDPDNVEDIEFKEVDRNREKK